jgi:hypothetical protein
MSQEGLNNVVTHAGATRVIITLCLEGDGRGRSSAGLGIMRERDARIGADLQIESRIGEGTAVRLRAKANLIQIDSPGRLAGKQEANGVDLLWSERRINRLKGAEGQRVGLQDHLFRANLAGEAV